MDRHIQADNAFIEWMEAMSKNVVHIADAWHAAVKWSDAHPDIDVRTMAAWRSGYKEAVEKACEWLEQNAYLYCDDIDTLHESALIGDFRHVMKGD